MFGPPMDRGITEDSLDIMEEPQHNQKHLRWTIDGPASSYSALVIHIDWKVPRADRMDPPIQTEYLRSGGAMILIDMVGGASAVISLDRRSARPSYMVEPPEHTTLAYRSLRMSTSHAMMVLKHVEWMPSASLPSMLGWKSASGHLKRAVSTWMTLPSGSS